MLTGRAMPTPRLRDGQGPPAEALSREMRQYILQLCNIHKTIYNEQQARERRLGKNAEEEGLPVRPGDYVFLGVFNRSGP